MFEKWRFEKLRKDRRAGYSFPGHFRRVVETKGFAQVVLTLGAAAIVAGTAFANCGGNSITGPSSDVAAAPAPPGKPQLETSKTGPARSTFITLPLTHPCTGETIIWDHGATMIESTAQFSTGLDGRVHVQFHMNSYGQGASATRRYSGSHEYNSQLFTVMLGDNNKFKFEWNMKMIARGEGEALFEDDDFVLHLVQTFSPPPDPIPDIPEATIPPGECR